MTEHSASIFVFFFLAEYSSIVLICMLNSILFFGGYLFILPVDLIIEILNTVFGIDNSILQSVFLNVSSSPINLGIKTALFVFIFI
jgi:NADH-ubiquinone oxidoreductase chain 1